MSDSSEYAYRRIFSECTQPALGDAEEVADRAPAGSYVFDENILLCVNVALATARPLLVRGPSGCGKSALAGAVASHAKWSYYTLSVTSRTMASDFLYEIDHLKRLQDAYQGTLEENDTFYLTPGPLFWAYNQEAACKLLDQPKYRGSKLKPPGHVENARRAVVLLDEIDKADPDVPNNLLSPLGQLEFAVPGHKEWIRAQADQAPLVILTTNEERDLPPAFLRRCVELVIPQLHDDEPTTQRLLEIARRHGMDLGDPILQKLVRALFDSARREGRAPSVAEYLDLLRAWKELDLESSPNEEIMSAVLQAITRTGDDGQHRAVS